MSPIIRPKSYYKWRIHKLFEEANKHAKAISSGQDASQALTLNQDETYALLSDLVSEYEFVSITTFGKRVYDRAFVLVYNLDSYKSFQEIYLVKMLFNPSGCVRSDVELLRKKLEKAR